jgi:FkbH-like protein
MLSNLTWLPAPPENFREQAKVLQARIGEGRLDDISQDIVTLATAVLEDRHLQLLNRLAATLRTTGADYPGLKSVKLGLVGDGTLSLNMPALVATGLRHGLLFEPIEGEYNSSVQESLDPESPVHAGKPDILLVSNDYRTLGLGGLAADAQDAQARVDQAIETVKSLVRNFKPSVTSAVLIQTIVPPIEPLFGNFDRTEPASPYAMVEAFNAQLTDWARAGDIILVDVARLAANVGIERWSEARHWHASKLTIAPDFIPLYADVVVRVVAAIYGKSRKCLVLDLDNTLWGGVIGDDGLTGIKLGQGSPTGEAFLAVQQMAKQLRSRGVILAVCSKNEEDVARSAFQRHPDMLLAESDIAVFQANWTDKASNLRAIATTLNIGVDALVFLDDNPAERLQVRRELPMVAVPELPEDPALYPQILAAAGYFETVSFSAEDKNRAEYYRSNAQRAEILNKTGDMESYLRSLEMICEINPVDAMSRARSSQLINKSNQFNLTTRRYSESEIEALETDDGAHLIQVRLTDKFGDNGIISVIIARKAADAWTIDTWLMSCRVLGRRVEEAVLGHLTEVARAAGARALVGSYIPSPKNRMVADHYKKLGFASTDTAEDGATGWSLDLEAYAAPDLPMTIKDGAL